MISDQWAGRETPGAISVANVMLVVASSTKSSMAADAARRSAADIARTVEDAAEALVRGALLLGAPDDAVRGRRTGADHAFSRGSISET